MMLQLSACQAARQWPVPAASCRRRAAKHLNMFARLLSVLIPRKPLRCSSHRQDADRLQHKISYTDGEVQWTTLAEEEWRRLSGDEALAARLQLDMLEAGEPGSPALQASQEWREQQPQQNKYCPLAPEEHQRRHQGTSAQVPPSQQVGGGPAEGAELQDQPHTSKAAVGAEASDAAAAAPAAAPGGTDRYLCVPDAELVPDTFFGPGLLRAMAPRKQQQLQQQVRGPLPAQAAAACRPAPLPSRFPQAPHQRAKQPRQPARQPQEPKRLEARPATAASGAPRAAPNSAAQPQQPQQQFSRKRKEPEESRGGGLATEQSVPLIRPAPAAVSVADGSGSGQQQQGAKLKPADKEPVLGTQDAAGALLTMLQARPAAAPAAEPLPLRPSSRHNAASAAETAGAQVAAAVTAAAAPPIDFVAASQLFAGLPPAQAGFVAQRSRGPALQDPGLFDGSQGGLGSGAGAAAKGGSAAAAARTGTGGSLEDPCQLRLPDLFKGATPSQPVWLPDSAAAGRDAELAAAATEEAAAPEPGDCTAASPVRVCIVISNTTVEIQRKVLRLQQLLPGVELQEHVSE